MQEAQGPFVAAREVEEPRGKAVHDGIMVAGQIRNFDAPRVDPSHELISASDDRRDKGRLGMGIVQRPAQAADMDLQVAVIDEDVGPSERYQSVFADLLSRPQHQQVENVQRPATQLHGPVLPQENPLARNKPERSERVSKVYLWFNSHYLPAFPSLTRRP